MLVVTHSGKFHADDVLSWSLLQYFHPQACNMTLVRTRDSSIIKDADIVFDVGGIYDPSRMRFDHHQNEYTGTWSSAGMVLDWLTQQQYISSSLSLKLQQSIVDYVDKVDNGIIETSKTIPCFAKIVDGVSSQSETLSDFDTHFYIASSVATMYIQSIDIQEKKYIMDCNIVQEKMTLAKETKQNFIIFDKYVSWKDIYFSLGGAKHPTEFILFPTMYDTWQVMTIPPTEDSFAQKTPLPQEWAGLRDEELSTVTGEPSIFCHKNRFTAVFQTKEAALSALKKFGLIRTRDS